MQSRTSFFNGTLLRKNLTRFWPLWGMASFVGALFPLALVMELLRNRQFELTQIDLAGAYYSVASDAVPVLSLIYAVLCAMAVWNYLYSARSVSMMHTMPIRREGLLATGFLSGMAMMLIPYGVTGVLCVLVSLVTGAFSLEALLVTVLAVLGESFFYFATATFAAFLTGNLFAMPAIYLVLHFLEVILDSLFSVLAQGFLTGVAGSYSGALEWLSPTVYLENTVWIDRVVEERLVNQDPYPSYYDYVTTEIHLRGLWVVGVYVLVGVVLLGLTYLLYRRRRSESAGDVVAAPWLRPVFRVVVTLLAALPGGMALYEIFWRSFQYSPYYQALPMAVCMCVAGLIGWYAAAMLLAKSLRVFRGSWKGAVAVVVCCAAVCGAMHTDVLGVAARVPNAADVTRIELRVAGNSYTLDAGEEDALIAQVVELHRAVVQDLDYLREKETELYNQPLTQEDEETLGEATTWIWLEYTLANGQHLMRSYDLFITRDRMAQAGTYDYLLDTLVNGEAMKAVRLHDGDPDYTLTGGYVSTNWGGSYDLGSREAEAIAAAVRRDAANGTWGTYEWFDSSDARDYAINMELTFEYQEQDSSGASYTSNDWITIRVRPEMTETVDCLLRLGLVTEADLVTRAELYPEDYAEEETVALSTPQSGIVVAEENTTVAVSG